MAVWRSRLKIPSDLDKKIKTRAVQKDIQLKVSVQQLLDKGIETLRNNGVEHLFVTPSVLARYRDQIDVEYVIDESYSKSLETISHLASGRGKKSKIQVECLLIGLIAENEEDPV